jgi:hypothetical protein
MTHRVNAQPPSGQATAHAASRNEESRFVGGFSENLLGRKTPFFALPARFGKNFSHYTPETYLITTIPYTFFGKSDPIRWRVR